MKEDKTKRLDVLSANIEEILLERNRLEEVLREKFKKEVSILFSDMCGYTKYMDSYGDISGRALLQKHNQIVLPCIEQYEGFVIKTIGDAVMASFSSPLAAVKASIAIQQEINKYNHTAGDRERIHVKIGINRGEALVEKTDIYGDVVNVASRIQSQAGPDQILISQSVYEYIKGIEDILCRFHYIVKVKGKAEPLTLYRVVCLDEDIVVSAEPKVRAYQAAEVRKFKKQTTVLRLEVALTGKHLKISAHEHIMGEENAMGHYEEIRASIEWINKQCDEIVDCLNKTIRKKHFSRESLIKLRETGRLLYTTLLTPSVKEKLKHTTAEYLTLTLDEGLAHVPWELFNNGQEFLCQQFNMGRLIKTRQSIQGIKSRRLAQPLKMLIIATSKEDLNEVYAEGMNIRDYVSHHNTINAILVTKDLTADFLKEKMKYFDCVHFAGHAVYDSLHPEESGWQLSGDTFRAQDVIKMATTSPMPAFIFSNTCKTDHAGEFKIFQLANAFLLSGVRHYVSTFWDILDEPSSRFALEFYKNFFSGKSIGEALRLSREALITEYGEDSIVWASYFLYGDPTSNYMAQIKTPAVEEEPAHMSVPQNEAERFADTGETKKKQSRRALVSGIILCALVILWGSFGFFKNLSIRKYKKAAVQYYHTGNFTDALHACTILEDKNPDIPLIYLIRGNINLREGNLDAAKESYQKALHNTKEKSRERAEAFIGLGRIASSGKQMKEAIEYYQRATEADPQSRSGYMAHAFVLEDSGRYDKALDLLEKAEGLDQKDRIVRTVINEIRQKVAVRQDQAQQERVDRMVKELLEKMKLSAPPALSSDDWTSPVLTIWFMDFSTKGFSLQEGEERLLASGITDKLLQYSRVTLVERILLDTLLGELNLGSSKIIDPATALSLGKIMAARLIVSGQVVYSGPTTHVSMRLIETETGRIIGAINESAGNAQPVSFLTEKLSDTLLKKLKKMYPLRGKIIDLKDKKVTLNVGQRVGVRIGQLFKVIDTPITLEVISVEADTNVARITTEEGGVQKGLRVEAL